MSVAIDLALFGGNAAGEKKVIHGDKGVARLVELVYHLKGRVYAFEKNVVHQNNIAVLHVGDDVGHLPLNVAIMPVLWVHGPEDDRGVGLLEQSVVYKAVGRAQEEFPVA